MSHSDEKAPVRELGDRVLVGQVMVLVHSHEGLVRMRHLSFVVPWVSVSL